MISTSKAIRRTRFPYRHSRRGFTLTELLVVVVVGCLLLFTLMPVMLAALGGAYMTASGAQGKTLYVIITGATEERGKSAWPTEMSDFPDSTEYFRRLFDERHAGTPAWNPIHPDFNYSMLAGNGVPECRDRRLAPENNMWTVAGNVGAHMDEMWPVLVTRNVDASSLAAPSTVTNSGRRLRFDRAWDMPFGDKGLILIRKNGAVFKMRAKPPYLNYATIYKGYVPLGDTGGGQPPAAPPFFYLTPTDAVEPGERAFAEGAVRQQTIELPSRVQKDIRALKVFGPSAATFWGAFYLAGFFAAAILRWRKKTAVRPSARNLALTGFHFIAVVLYSTATMSRMDMDYHWLPVYVLLAALAVQACAIAVAARWWRRDRDACLSGIKWILAAPLFVFGACLLLIVLAVIEMSLR